MFPKKWLWLLLIIPSVVTYGAIYAYDQQSIGGGYLSHQKNSHDHLEAFIWAIFPPMWVAAPFITNEYEYGIRFRHHHLRPCNRNEFCNCERNMGWADL